MYSGLTAMKKKSVAVVIISNGPGELATWVSPVVNELNKINQSQYDKDKLDFCLRLVLVPCPNATGKEFLVANSWNKFDLITKSKSFWKLLIKPHSFANWPKSDSNFPWWGSILEHFISEKIRLFKYHIC